MLLGVVDTYLALPKADKIRLSRTESLHRLRTVRIMSDRSILSTGPEHAKGFMPQLVDMSGVPLSQFSCDKATFPRQRNACV